MLIECNATDDTIMELFSDKTQMYHGTGVAILIDEIKRLRSQVERLRSELARYQTPNVDNVEVKS